MSQIKSPNYPSLGLADAIDAVAKIEGQYRSSAAAREDAAKLMGYTSLSGPATKSLAALASYGLAEKAGKGMLRVTPLARAIFHLSTEKEKADATVKAGMTPNLFREIRDHFEDVPVPPEQGVITFLNRAGFNPSAVPKAARAFLNTAEMLERLEVTESYGVSQSDEAESDSPGDETTFGGASVGDMIQWESQGALQFETPRRVRWVSKDGDWLAVEGSDTGIPMSQVTVELASPPKPPAVPPRPTPATAAPSEKGFSEWFRAKVGSDKIVTINFKGEGEIGPKEIEKMIRVLEAQKLALED